MLLYACMYNVEILYAWQKGKVYGRLRKYRAGRGDKQMNGYNEKDAASEEMRATFSEKQEKLSYPYFQLKKSLYFAQYILYTIHTHTHFSISAFFSGSSYPLLHHPSFLPDIERVPYYDFIVGLSVSQSYIDISLEKGRHKASSWCTYYRTHSFLQTRLLASLPSFYL